MGGGDPKPTRTVTSTDGHEVVQYSFSIEIHVRKAELDDKAVRAIVDDEFQKLKQAIVNSR